MAKRHVSRKPTPIRRIDAADFQRYLEGEQAPTEETLATLFRLSDELYEQAPWKGLEETDLILVDDPKLGERCYCSVMGMLGEHLSLHAYIGTRSYQLFDRIQNGGGIRPTEYWAGQQSVSVVFEPPKDLEPVDRAAARRWSKIHGRAPFFRSYRFATQPWYVTEDEAHTLILCIRAVQAVWREYPVRGPRLWRDGRFPLVKIQDAPDGYSYEITTVPEPPAGRDPARAGKPDPELLGKVASLGSRGGTIEVGSIQTASAIGDGHSRPRLMRVMLVVDPETGAILSSKAWDQADFADVLVDATLQACVKRRRVPEVIHAIDRETRQMLMSIAPELEIRVEVRPTPLWEEACEALLQHVGDTSEKLMGGRTAGYS